MSDNVSHPSRVLSDRAAVLANAGQFAEAAELYKQSYDLYPTAFVASKYISCLRSSKQSAVAVAFRLELPKKLLDDKFVHAAISWAIYDVYFKKAEDSNEHEVDSLVHEEYNSHEFQKMQNAANYVLSKLDALDEKNAILRNRIIFSLCREAKQRGQWQVMYDFAIRLDPTFLSTNAEEWNGKRLASDYQQWLYIIVRSLLELERYTESLEYANKGIEAYPGDKLFYWWQACNKQALGEYEVALKAFENIDTRFPKEWYIQRDVAMAYLQLQRDDDAWLWFCKAANFQGEKKGRYKMFEQMAKFLERSQRLSEAHDHLQLAYAIAEREQWERQAEMLRTQIFQFRKRHIEHYPHFADIPIEGWSSVYPRCTTLWQEIIRASRPQRKGSIKMVNIEKEFGFITSDNEDFHFRYRDMLKRAIPVAGLEVEFEIEKSYDIKKQKDSFKAVNIRLIKKDTSFPNENKRV